jgi:cellulose synthase/poly-beta-1,6-N-acetylglucosamine synthase-like glycosyltransferase
MTTGTSWLRTRGFSDPSSPERTTSGPALLPRDMLTSISATAEEQEVSLQNGKGSGRQETASVIVPCYNSRDTISECIESIVSQDYRPLEIVVVDDGSTDETSNEVMKVMKRYEGIRLVQSQHKGPSHARNIGMAESTIQELEVFV